jgi:3-hydroxyisobutyrate dehydrogenase-like beta-hydroxyacid dehydrogenase
MKITFIGLGIMGSNMAFHLIKNKVNLTVYNRTDKNIDSLNGMDVIIADSLQNAVQDADIVFSMLSTPEAVEEVFFGKGKVLSFMKANAIWVDCSTVNPSFSVTSSKKAKAHKIQFLDAPVAGSKPQAQNAELVFFVGGSKKIINIVEPYLLMMGKKIIQLGDIGQGSSFKMLVNCMLAQSMLIFSEAVLLGTSLGISKDFLLDTLPNLVVSAPFTKFKAAAIKSNTYDVQFPLEWMHKDLHLATLTAYEKKQPLFLTNLTKELYADAKKMGMGRLDFSAIHQYLEMK